MLLWFLHTNFKQQEKGAEGQQGRLPPQKRGICTAGEQFLRKERNVGHQRKIEHFFFMLAVFCFAVVINSLN